jgi:hypothetical protein
MKTTEDKKATTDMPEASSQAMSRTKEELTRTVCKQSPENTLESVTSSPSNIFVCPCGCPYL